MSWRARSCSPEPPLRPRRGVSLGEAAACLAAASLPPPQAPQQTKPRQQGEARALHCFEEEQGL